MLVQSVDSYRGGADGFIVDWVRTLAKKVDRLVVLTYHYNPKEKLPENTLVLKICGKNIFSRNFDLLKKIVVIGKKEKIEVIFAHILEIFGIIGAIAGKLIGAKSFFWYCQSYNISRNIMARTALALVDGILTCSAEFKDQYAFQAGEFLRDKTDIIGHAVDISRFRTRAVTFPTNGEMAKIAYAGRISPIKDVLTMLTAVEILRKSDYKVTFHLFGGWGVTDQKGKQFQAQLFAKIKEINANKKIVYFEGPKPFAYTESAKIFYSADLFVMPGLKTLGEILSCGVTTVFPDAYISYVGRGFPQLTYKLGDADDLAAKIAWLIDHPEETVKITKEACTNAQKIFSLSLLMDKAVASFNARA